MSLPPVYLVDASVYLFRAWFSMPDDFVNGAGQPTNAVYGFSGFLCSLLEQTGAEHVAVAFDVSLASSFRNEIYPEYKANRDPAPEELKRQFDWARAVAEAMGLQCFADPRYEADDLIGTLAGCLRPAGFTIEILSADKDLAQLVGDSDVLWDYARDRRHASDDIPQLLGVHPAQVADWLALTGDAVDNIPGVPGIGAKTAAALLDHFGSLEAIYANLERVYEVPVRGAKTLGAKLELHREAAELARRLTGIALDAPVRDGPLDPVGPRLGEINALFDEVDFGMALRRQAQRIADLYDA